VQGPRIRIIEKAVTPEKATIGIGRRDETARVRHCVRPKENWARGDVWPRKEDQGRKKRLKWGGGQPVYTTGGLLCKK